MFNICRVPGNSAAVTALQEELNNRGIENVCLEDEVVLLSLCPYNLLMVFSLTNARDLKMLQHKIDLCTMKFETTACGIIKGGLLYAFWPHIKNKFTLGQK